MDSNYLKNTVGSVLQKALLKTVIASPNDPIEHLANLLRAEANLIDKQKKIESEVQEEIMAVSEQERQVREATQKVEAEKNAQREAELAVRKERINEALAQADKEAFVYTSLSTRYPSTIGMFASTYTRTSSVPSSTSSAAGAAASSMLTKAKGTGVVANLEASGADILKAYGEGDDVSSKEDAEIKSMVAAMYNRVLTSAKFTGERVAVATLSESTLQGEIDGMTTATYLWDKKHVVPVLALPTTLSDEVDGCQCVTVADTLDATLDQAKTLSVFGVKLPCARVGAANDAGVGAVVAQQVDVAKRVLAAGLCPMVAIAVDVAVADKAAADKMVVQSLVSALGNLTSDQTVMVSLTAPAEEGAYTPLTSHANVVRVASGATALIGGLTKSMSESDYDEALDKTIQSAFDALA